ncbi:MAG: autotransporter-associated beta strand repeat-containing protein [Prosthecobacter sp.]|uniref:autotransporter-associated beta strand repeat-containing protein n=1 Tax=Prosthecobacter sp. TaxID=1965333 RepID=UPI0026216D30|nr:autotransporter-associated beta strand repeat-containing protein [Prosthecobacter sp.]MCF7788655.1 autotransporter-associated beta strand repeat-containing protein [Prosthecobacter sp.]
MYDPTTASGSGGFYTDEARALITANEYWTRAVLGQDGTNTSNAYNSHLMLTRADQVFNAPYLYVYNDNRNGTLTIGGENTSGSVYYGSRDNSVNFSMQITNQTSERDVRFLQVRGGTLVWNGRLADENGTPENFNSSISIVGPGTVIFNRNALGNSTVDRWNFMAGEAHWSSMTGNDQFASNSTNALVGQSTWGGGRLVLDDPGTARSQQLNSHIWLLNGASSINTQNNTTFILGNAAANLTRRSGSSLAFLEDGSGTIQISAVGLSTTDGDFLGSWAVYGSSTGITDWAARAGTADVQAFTAYTDDTVGAGVHTNLTGDLALGGSANTATVRFATGANLDLGGGALTVVEGGILIPSAVTGAVNISNGTLTSGWSSGSGDLMLYNYGTGTTTISAVITDNAGKVNLVNAGSGTTVLQGANTYTGNTYLNNGVLQISSEGQLGAIDGSIDRLARVYVGYNNGASKTNSALYFIGGGGGSGAAGVYTTNGGQNVTATTLTNGGSGYTSGVYVNTLSDTTGNAGIWALMNSGSLHFDGGTLAVTNDITLDGARTLYLGGNGGTLDVAAGSNLTINGYITSEFNQVTTANGYNYSDQIGGSDQPASDRNPDIGDLIIQGGGTVLIMGAPDNTVRSYMYNSYGGITWINEGTIKIAGAGTSAYGALGTNRSASDGTIIGANGSLEFATTSDPSIYEWLTLGGTGYEGRGAVLTTGTGRVVRLNGQMQFDSPTLFNLASNSYGYIRLGEQGGALYGSGDILRTGGNEFGFYVNAPDWTGRFLGGSGTNRVSGTANLQGMLEMELDRNSILYYSAGSNGIDEFRDRLNDNLVTTINGYAKIRIENYSGAFSGEEKIGVVNVNSGVFGIEFALGGDVINGAVRLQGDYAAWHFTDIVRTPGSVVMVRNFDPGMDISSGVTDLTNRALVLVDNAPTMVGAGDGTNGNTAIIAGFFGGTRPTLLNTTTGIAWDEDRTSRYLMTSVLSTDPITGAPVYYLRPLSDAPGSTDYKIISDTGTVSASAGPLDLATAGISADQNVRFVGITDDAIGNGFTSRVNTIMTLDSVVEANSVSFGSDTTSTNVNGAGNQVNLVMTLNGGLKIDSGVLMFANIGTMDRLGNGSNTGINLDMNNYILGGSLDFNGKEAIIYAGSEWAQYNVSGNTAYNNADGDNTTAIIRSSIYNTGGNGLTKTGGSSVTLEAANYYTGDTTVNYGNLYARHDLALGQSTQLNVTGGGNFIIGYNSRIMGVDLHIGQIYGNNLGLYAEGDGTEWGGNVIIDNVDSTGSAGGFSRNFVPRIDAASSNTVMRISGNVYGGDTVVSPGAQATSRIFTTLTGASYTTLDFMGQIRDKSTGAVDLSGGDTLNDVLRMEVAANNDTANVHLYQQYDSAGRIILVRGMLRYMGTGNFYSDAAALAMDPNSDLSGFQMGGRSVISGDGTGASDVGFYLHNEGSTFNLSSWYVGVDITDPNNSLGNSNYGFGNTTGNSSLGGENITGTITFGTGTGSIRFTQATTLYNRNLNIYAARGGTVDMKVNFLDGGDFVNSSITKVGAGTVRLLGSTAGDSTVEALKMLGGTLELTGYDVNASRRVGNGAALTLSGGYLIVDATAGTAQEDFSDLTLNSGGSRLAVRGNATVNINSSITLNPESGVTMAFVENGGGVINISATGMTTTDGDRLGYWAVYGNVLGQITDWAAREGTTGVQAFTAYDVNSFVSGNNTEVTTGANFVSDTTTNSIKFATAANLDLGGNTLTVENGGMLVSYAAGGAVNITNGTLTRSGAGDILLHNYGTDITTISANITNDGANAVNLVTGGVGTTVLSGNNSYTGDTYINGGTLQISSESQLGNIDGSIARLVREYNGFNNGGSKTNSALFFLGGGGGSGAAGVYSTNSAQNVTTTTLNNGGSGYTSGIYVNTLSGGTGNAGIWAILDSGNLHIDGGTLATTEDITLNGARTIFLGASGATFDVAAGKTLTINGYITSDVTDLIPGDDNPIELTRPFVGGLAVEGGGTLVLTGAPDNTSRDYMYNGYNALTSINNGTIKIAGLASTSINALGTYSGWVDSTYIGQNGTLMMSVTNGDSYIYDWLTLDGQGYQGGGTIQFVSGTGTVRSTYIRGQINVLSDAVFNARNGSNIYLQNGGGEVIGSGDIIKIGQGDFRFYGNSPHWTGSFYLASGSSRMYDGSAEKGMVSMTLQRNGYFAINADSTSSDELTDRLGDDLIVNTDGYIRMRIEAYSNVFSGIEKIGTANVLSGQLGLEFDLGSTLAGGAPVLGGDYAGWHFTEIVRSLGATVQLRGLDAGTSFADSSFNANAPSNANANVQVVQVDILPTLIGSGDGSNGNAAIAPGFYGGVRPDWINAAGTGNIYNEDYIAGRLVTVDTNTAGDHFLRPLLDSEYKVVGNPDTAQTTSIRLEDQGISADQNLKIVGVTSDSLGVNEFTNRQNSFLTLGSIAADCTMPTGINMVINSLSFSSESFGSGINGNGNWTSLMIADGATLRINSGVIQEYNTGLQNMHGAAYNGNLNLDIRSSLNGGMTDFNSMEANFYIGGLWAHYNTSDAINAYRATDGDNNYFYMNSSIVNAIGLTKTGSASLFLGAVNYYTGLTSVNQGALYARHDKALGASTQVNVTGAGTFVIGLGARIAGVDLYVGALNGINTALQIENNSVWAGNVIIDNVDAGGATAYARSFLPRIFSNTTGLATIEGNIFGGDTAIGSGARTDSRIFSTYTGAWGLLYLNGVVQDNSLGALTGPVDIYTQSQVLRMEVTATNDESAVQIGQQYNAAGRINIDRGSLYYSGNGDFYTAAAAATVNSNPLNPMIGLQMGGRSLTSDNGLGTANLGFFLLNAGANFNLKSWQVGGDMNDPENLAGNYTYGLSNSVGNSTIGGVNLSGTVNFGTGDGAVMFNANRGFISGTTTTINTTNGSTAATVSTKTDIYVGMSISGANIAPGTYISAINPSNNNVTLSQSALGTGSNQPLTYAGNDRDLGLFAASGGEVNFRTNFVDGGALVNSSITKQGGGQVNLLGSTAGDSTVEGVNVMGGFLVLAGYDTNLNRRVGSGAYLTLAGGTLAMDGSGASFTENFGSLKINQGGNGIAAAGNGVSSFGTISIAGSSITRAAAGTIQFQSIAGGVINFSNAGMKNVGRIGSYATYGANTAFEAYATDWAATDAAGNVIAYTGYSDDSFGAGLQTNIVVAGQTAAATNSIRFNVDAGTITGGTLTLNDGGLLITSLYTGGTPIAAGVGVTTSGSGVDLLIHNYATGVVNFDGSITGGQNVVFTGTGELAFTSPSSVSSSVVASTTVNNSYTVTVGDTSGLTVGMDVSGASIAAGTKILSITNGTTLVLTKLVTAPGTNDLTYSSTSYTPANTYAGATHVTGSAVVSFNDVGAFGSTSGFYLNGGTLNYSEVGATSAALTQNIILGGNNGILSVTNPDSVLIIRGGAANQFSSETSNIIAAYGTNNPNAGGLQIVGSGTVQFGDRSGFSNNTTEDLLGVVNNYTGLTILGDGVNALRVDIQGKGNNNAQYTLFGTTQSWADGTIIKDKVTVEFSMVRDSARTGQLRFREWFQIGEKAGDQITFDGSTQRQPTFDGILNIIGDLTFQTQGNRYGDAGSTGNSEYLINPNEGGVMGSGDIYKLGDGNLRFYTQLNQWTGDLYLEDGFTSMNMNNGAMFNPIGKIYIGDPTGVQTSLVRLRIENRWYGNNTVGIESPAGDMTVNRDIIIQDNIKQEVRIEAGYLPQSAMIHFTNNINMGSGSSSFVRFYYEDNVNLDPSLVGHNEQTVFDITGNLSGSNAMYVDANNYAAIYNNPLFVVWLRGDNSGYSGLITIGADNGTSYNPKRNAVVRVGSAAALGTNGAVAFRNGGTLQLGGNSITYTGNFLFTGGVGNATTAGIENASGTAATITFDSGTQTGVSYQDIDIGLRNGVAAGVFGGGAAELSVVKIGTGDTVFGASTGGGSVVFSFSNYTGNTLVQEGTLYAGTNNSFSPNSRFIVSSGATLSPYWGEAGTGFQVTIGSLAGVDGALVNIDSSTLSVGYDGTNDADFAGVISGFGNLSKIGGGTQTLSGVNTFTGNLGVAQGTLIGSNNSAFGDAFNTIGLGGVIFIDTAPLDAKVELLLAGTASDVTNSVSMNYYSGNDEGITVIGTRETSGSYGFGTGGTVALYQDVSTNVFFEADGSSTFKFGDAVTDAGSNAMTNVVKIGAGTVELRVANTYGRFDSFDPFTPLSGGAAIDGGTVIRHGTISIFNNDALATTAVELGDTRYDLASAYLATTGSLITKANGSYDVSSDGAGGVGNGAFLNVNALVDGVAITAADYGKRILVKDESANPEYNGVYEVVSVDASCGQMNLVRVSDFDDTTEMLYGSSIAVTSGTTQAGLQFFQASSDVTSVNTATTDPVHWLQDIPNADVALLAANGGMTILNNIDINDTNGSGRTILGGSFTSDTTYFSGNVTLQHSTLPGVDNIRELSLFSASNDDLAVTGEKGVVFSGVISEAQVGDTLSVNKQDTGTVTFTNDNTYTGKTTVTEGTLALAGAGNVSGTSWIEVNDGATFDFSNSTAAAGDFTYDHTFSGSGTVEAGSGTLYVGTDGGVGVLSPGMSSDPTNSGTAGDGIGVLTVNGNVVLAGDTTGVDRLTLQMGATNGADYNDAANITAHSGIGDLGAYLNSQGAFYDTQTGGSHDRLVVNGDLTLNSGGQVSFNSTVNDYQPVVGDVFNLIDWTSVTATGFDVGNGGAYRGGGLLGDLALPDLSLSGLVYDTSLFTTYGIVVVVPEPGRMMLLLFGLTTLFLGRRRRR